MTAEAKLFDETWFYAPLKNVGELISVPETEETHMLRVLRLSIGTEVLVSNGMGTVFLCKLNQLGKQLHFEALEKVQEIINPPALNLVLCWLKGKDLEIPIEGLCQLTIAQIHLVFSDYTQEFKDQNYAKAVERLKQKSLVALKQAKKAWLTEILEPISLSSWREQNTQRPLIIAHPGSDKLPENKNDLYYLLIGSEGGFSPREIDGFKQDTLAYWLGLGETRLRAIHAPLLACGKLMGLGFS